MTPAAATAAVAAARFMDPLIMSHSFVWESPAPAPCGRAEARLPEAQLCGLPTSANAGTAKPRRVIAPTRRHCPTTARQEWPLLSIAVTTPSCNNRHFIDILRDATDDLESERSMPVGPIGLRARRVVMPC